jgi:Family of unknown function (DUF6361)
MSQLGWIDFSPTHRNKVMLVMDLFKEQGVIDELGLGTIRDSISDLIFPGTSTIQTRAKYFLLIPWILQDIESRGKTDRFQSELEESEVHFIKVLRSKTNTGGIIGATLRNANPKRKPSSIYWSGLRTYDILNFKGSISDYINYQKHYAKKRQTQKKQIVEADGNVQGDDRDANHLYQQHLWCQLPKPAADWKTNLTIDLTEEEAKFLQERIIRSNPDSLWSFTLNHISKEARTFSSIADFLSVEKLPEKLRELLQLAVDFNTIMQGALIRYNLLIQTSRENGRAKELQPIWNNYWKEIQKFDWNSWDTNQLWKYCPFTQFPTKRFVESWIEIVKSNTFNQTRADQLLKDRELRLKGVRRARLNDKAIAQKQESFTGISVFEDGTVSYLNYRWNTVRTFLNDIQNGLANNVTAK